MRHPVEWIQGGSNVWFGLAAALTNAITTVALARLVSGRELGERRVLVAAVSYGLFCSGHLGARRLPLRRRRSRAEARASAAT